MVDKTISNILFHQKYLELLFVKKRELTIPPPPSPRHALNVGVDNCTVTCRALLGSHLLVVG